MEIIIKNKYLYVHKKEKKIAYFEIFEEKQSKHNVIKLSIQDKEGDKFLKDSNCKIQNADVFWFSKKKLKYKIMFIKGENSPFSHLILIKPKLLTNTMGKSETLQGSLYAEAIERWNENAEKAVAEVLKIVITSTINQTLEAVEEKMKKERVEEEDNEGYTTGLIYIPADDDDIKYFISDLKN